jgi:hypothetical protein
VNLDTVAALPRRCLCLPACIGSHEAPADGE